MVPGDVCRHSNHPKKGLAGCSKHLISTALGRGNTGSTGYQVKHQNRMCHTKHTARRKRTAFTRCLGNEIIQQNSEKAGWIKNKKTQNDKNFLLLGVQLQCIFREKYCYCILMVVTTFLIHLFTTTLGALLPSDLCHLQKTRAIIQQFTSNWSPKILTKWLCLCFQE